MHRRFIAAVVATAILFTGFATAPAQANQEDVGRALAALLGIAIVGAAIQDSKNQNRVKVRVFSKPKKKVHVQARPLPSKCLHSFETDRGTVQMFGLRCLDRKYGFTHRLPKHCERFVRTDRGSHFGFGARCLRKQGYKSTRR